MVTSLGTGVRLSHRMVVFEWTQQAIILVRVTTERTVAPFASTNSRYHILDKSNLKVLDTRGGSYVAEDEEAKGV